MQRQALLKDQKEGAQKGKLESELEGKREVARNLLLLKHRNNHQSHRACPGRDERAEDTAGAVIFACRKLRKKPAFSTKAGLVV